MIVNFIVLKDPKWLWISDFIGGVKTALELRGHAVRVIDTTGVERDALGSMARSLARDNPCDVWFCAQHGNWIIPELVAYAQGPIIAHAHGGPELGFTGAPQGEVFSHLLSAVTTNSRVHEEALRKRNVSAFAVGFPLLTKQGSHGPNARDGIVVPGRLGLIKQTGFLISSLADWHDMTTFVAPARPEDPEYRVFSFGIQANGYSLVSGASLALGRSGYFETLRHSRVAVTAALNDSLNLSIIEAYLEGCEIVAPDEPLYREVFGGSIHYFEPLSLRALRRAVWRALDASVRDPEVAAVPRYPTLVNPEAVGKRLERVFRVFSR